MVSQNFEKVLEARLKITTQKRRWSLVTNKAPAPSAEKQIWTCPALPAGKFLTRGQTPFPLNMAIEVLYDHAFKQITIIT